MTEEQENEHEAIHESVPEEHLQEGGHVEVPHREIDLNALFPEKGVDLNRLFPDEGTKRLLSDLKRNKRDVDRFVKSFSLEEEQ